MKWLLSTRALQGLLQPPELLQAALEVLAALLDALTENGFAAEHVAATNADGETALHYAAWRWVKQWSERHEELGQRLLEAASMGTVKARTRNRERDTDLHTAALCRSPFALQLVHKGADVK